MAWRLSEARGMASPEAQTCSCRSLKNLAEVPEAPSGCPSRSSVNVHSCSHTEEAPEASMATATSCESLGMLWEKWLREKDAAVPLPRTPTGGSAPPSWEKMLSAQQTIWIRNATRGSLLCVL